MKRFMNKPVSIFLLTFGTIVLVLGTASGAGAASEPKDVLKVKINQISPPSIVALTAGGSPLAQGVLSNSPDIVVNYNLNSFTFPSTSSEFGKFDLGLEIQTGTSGGGGPTSYPLDITLSQPGGPALTLTPNPATYNGITGPGVIGTSEVTMSINCPDCTNEDGSKIEALLQFSASGNPKLDENVKVKVEITLVHPTGGLSLYNFVTDQSLMYPAASTEVVTVKSGKNAGKINSTTPFGQFSDNILVVNTGANPEAFDLRITLDYSFDTNPSNNPGNAVFTYVGGASVDPETFDIDDFTGPTPQGQLLCLTNVTVQPEQSLLATVHMGIKRGFSTTLNPEGGTFMFTADILPPGSGCIGTPTHTDSANVTYTIK